MNFRKEVDPSGVKGLLALLRTNQDGPRPVALPVSSPFPSNNIPFSGQYQPVSFSLPSSHVHPSPGQPLGISSATHRDPPNDAPPHPLDLPGAATDYSYLAGWETETRALNDARRVDRSRGRDQTGAREGGAGSNGISASQATLAAPVIKASSTAESNPELMALLNTLRTSAAGPPTVEAGPSSRARPSYPVIQPEQVLPSAQASSSSATSSKATPRSILKSSTSSISATREAAISRYAPHGSTSEAEPQPKRRKMTRVDEGGQPADSSSVAGSKNTGFSIASLRSSVVDEGELRKGDATLARKRDQAKAESARPGLVLTGGVAAVPGTSGVGNDDGAELGAGAEDMTEVERNMPFVQALGIISGLLDSSKILTSLEKLKEEQSDMETAMFTEREKLFKAFDRRISAAANKNDLAEAARLTSEKRRHLNEYDLSTLKRFDDLAAKQHLQLERLGFPGLGPLQAPALSTAVEEGNSEDGRDPNRGEGARGLQGKEWRKRRAKVIKVLEEAIA